MTLFPEDQKLLDYYAARRKREAFKRFLQGKLLGDPNAVKRQKLNWAPVRRDTNG